MAKCLQTLKVCQGSGERQDYAFNLTDEFAKRWVANRPYPAMDRIRPASLPGTGFEYQSSGGVSNGAAEPPWPEALAGQVADGSIATWTAVEMSYGGLRHRIDSVDWQVIDGLTLADQSEEDQPGLQEIRIWVESGAAPGKYNFSAIVTTDQGAEFECPIELTIV